MSLHPLRFEPYLRPMVWGGRRLAELGKNLPDAQSYGESWEVSDHPSHHSVVAEGPLQGRTLHQLMAEPRALLGDSLGDSAPVFPWLIKILDCCDLLSVQVHPDEQAVKTLWPGEGPKTEAWYVLATEPGSRIWAGLKPGVDEAILRSALEQGSVADCLHSFEPRLGDCLYLPAGTVHAVGGGVLMAEVQQTSDATFRLFDWNRRDPQGKSRQLHIEQAIAAIHWEYGPVEPVRAAKDGGDGPLIRGPYFDVLRSRIAEPQFLEGGDGFEAALVLSGRGRLQAADVSFALQPGQTWLFPAWLNWEYLPEEPLELLIFTSP